MRTEVERIKSLWDSHAKDPEFEEVSLRDRRKPQNGRYEDFCLLDHFCPEDAGSREAARWKGLLCSENEGKSLIQISMAYRVLHP